MSTFADYVNKKQKKKNSFSDYTNEKIENRESDIDLIKKTTNVKKNNTVKTDNDSWFKKSSYFDDGYQVGDLLKTIGASLTDIVGNAGAGVLGTGESLVDTLANVANYLNKAQTQKEASNLIMHNALTGKSTEGISEFYQAGQNEVEKGTAEFIKKDLYDEEAIAKKILTDNIENAFDVDIEANSVFGEKADSLAQSGGQLLATAGLQAVGVPWWLTTGITTFGAETENALNQGATIDEATFSGLVSAGAEILTDKLSGGIKFGGKALDDALTDKLAKNISNKALRTLLKFGMDAVGEGNEEILSGVMSAIGQKLSYADDKELNELFSSEDAWDSFIGGAVLGGFSSAKNVVKGKVNSVDTVTGLTKNEQAVFDKVYKDTIAEREKGGEKLTAKEKTKIYDDVLNKLEKGYINTDTIESVLGGDTYKQYQAEVDNEKALQDEFNTLNKMKQGDMTGEQQDRRNELKEQLKAIKEGTTISDLKTKLSTEVSELAKNSRLAESYNEKSRKSQAFEADLSQYDEKQQSAVKRAIDSGILNNTNRTHEFVDLIAKLEADKGVLFDFTNNKKIKDTGFAVEGKDVAGYVQGNNIAINIDSSKALNTVVGHEITHILEGTELYPALQDAVKIFAESKGEYNSKLQSITEMYDGIEDANIENELTAELVGEYLFSNTDFIKNLSVEQPGLFQKIYDEVKYLCKVATTRSKEARELEKVKKTFAEVYRQKNNTVTDNGVKYSISEIKDQNDKSYGIGVKLDSTLLDNLTPKERIEMVKEYVKELGGQLLSAYDNNGNAVNITIAKSDARFKNNNGKSKSVNKDLTTKYVNNEVKQEAIALIDELVITSKYDNSSAPLYPHDWLDDYGKNDWEYWTTYIQDKNNTIWEATLNVANTSNGEKILYDIYPIKKAGQSVKSDTSAADSIISNSAENVKENDTKFSLVDGSTDIAPEMNNNIYGEDIKLQQADNDLVIDDDVPIKETTSTETTHNDLIQQMSDIMDETSESDDKEDLPDYFVDSENKQKTKLTRKAHHSNIIEGFKSAFVKDGLDLDETLKTGKRHSAFFNNDNTPQRVLEKTFGYKAGKILADLTVNKIAQNETEGIKWLNTITGKKGLLRKLSKEYNIKPGSNESAAAQMYLEGFYVNESDEYVRYGDAELAADFSDRNVRENIRLFAKDPRVREFYDISLNAINEARVRNAYDPIPRRDNYALHFRAMDDFFSRLGVPLNPNDIKAKDLPTDLNGVTVDLKPGQPYFASAKHRMGVKTTYDLLGGMERYANSAKNQIYHIDDIQNLRALRNYIADTFGQAKGLEGIDELTADQAKERIEQVYSGHLSNFAMWLNEEANHVAGKTALMDRAVEGMFGRRGLQFLSKLNGMVGSNQVGLNISSSLTNIIPVVQTFARTNKYDFAKAFSQTVLNTARRFSGNDDGFAEKSPVMIRRKGAESFAKTPYQKATDAGYAFMSAVDGVATELIARTKFNEYTRKGMDEQKAHIETDKWVSKLMGDRSLGQQPLLYNSKTLGLFTKYQLEVRNQLDSMFYDTIQESKEEYENIERNLARNAKTAAKYTATLFELAVAQHFFGTAFESMAGYNPAFDIIEVILTACGYGDDEDSEDTTLDNLEQAFFELLGDLPYSSLITGGGRIPISSALPIQEVIMGKDQNGYDLSKEERVLELLEALPYYLLPTGYGQIKKTIQGLSMFDDDLPIAGSYTDSGNLRFTVDETMDEMLRAGLFGQYANKNARDYFDNERAPLKEKQIQELIDLDIPIQDYWEIREGLSDLGQYATLNEKGDYIGNLDLPVEKKNILINNIADRDEPIDLTDFDKYKDFEEFDFATRYPEKYAVLQEQGISVKEYKEKYEETAFMYTDDFSWAANNPESYVLSKAVTDDVMMYKKYTSDLYAIKADKDSNGKPISGSAKNKKLEYINNLDIDFGAKLILFKSQYKSDDRYNYEIIDYLNSRDDISRDEMITILEELDFIVDDDGNISWK